MLPPSALRRRLLAGAAIALPLAFALPSGKDARAQNVITVPSNATQNLVGMFGTQNPFVTVNAEVLIDVAMGPGILGTAVPWGLVNLGTVLSADSAGIDLTMGGSVGNRAGGTIFGATYGVRIAGGPGTVANAGTIQSLGTGVALMAGGTLANGVGGLIAAGTVGVSVGGGPAMVANLGTIRATAGTGISGLGATVANSGLVEGLLDGVSASTVFNAGTIAGSLGRGAVIGGRLENAGTIGGALSGVASYSVGPGSYSTSYTIVNQGGVSTIVRDPPMLAASAATATIVNSGAILGGAGQYLPSGAVRMEGFGLLDNRAGGIVAGGVGVLAVGGAPEQIVSQIQTLADGVTFVSTATLFGVGATVLNAGTIIGLDPAGPGGDGVAVQLGGGDDLLVLATGSTLVGIADGGSNLDDGGKDRVLLVGTGSEDNAFVDFETLVMRGADWSLSGTSTVVTSFVELGRLAIDGRLASPTVSVLSAGTLGGIGTIVGTVANAGTLAPGRSIGSLTIDGTILGNPAAVLLRTGVSVSNATGGLIAGGTIGIDARANQTTAMTVAGTITTYTTRGLATSVANAGRIVGTLDAGVRLAQGGSVDNAASGTITGGQFGVDIGGLAPRSDTVTTLTTLGGSVTQTTTITTVVGSPAMVNNAGTITGGSIGVILAVDGTVVNSGLASGGIGIAAPTIFNFGTVVGTRTIGGETVSVVGGTNNDLLVLGNGSVLVGRADGGTAAGNGPDTDTVLLIQSGSEDDDFVNYETLRVNGVNWELTGTSTFVTSFVEMGRLGVGGTLTSPSVSVLQPGTLGGIGTVVGTVANAGTVNPGPAGTLSGNLLADIASRVGTLTIVGSFNNGTAGVFQVDVTPASGADRLVVAGTSGNATVGGSTADAVTGDAMFTPGQRFTVLTTSGTVGGTFGTLTTDFQSVFIDPTLVYLFNNGAPMGAVNQVDLVFVRNGTMVNDVARTFNQRNVAGVVDAIETIGAGAPAAFQTLITLIQNLDTERDVQDLLDNLSGEAHGSTESLLLRSGERFIASVLSSGGASAFSFSSLAAAPGEAPQVASLEDPAALVAQAGEAEAGGGAGLWVRPFAVTGNIDSDGNAGGFDFSAGGIAGGAAFEVADGFFLGAALGYEAQEADFDRFGDDAEADTLEAAIYAGFEDGPLRVTGALGYAHHSADVDRNVTNELGTLVPVTSDYDADQILVGAAGSYAIELDGGMTVTPQAALTFARLDRDGFTERGDTPALLEVGDETTESLLGRIGARIAMDFEMEEWTLTPAASLDVAHEFLDEFGSIDARFAAIPEAGSFTARGAEIGPTAVELGLGLAATDGEGLGFFLDYRGGFSSSGEEHAFAAGLRLSW